MFTHHGSMRKKCITIVAAISLLFSGLFTSSASANNIGGPKIVQIVADDSNPDPLGDPVSAPDGNGYWLIGADKKAYGFGSVAN